MSTPRVSIDWNGSVFVLTHKNDLDGSTSYKYSYDGIDWTNTDISGTLLGAANHAYVAKWTGTHFFVGGNLSSSSSGNPACALTTVDGEHYSILKQYNPPQIHDIEINREYCHTLAFPRTTHLAVGSSYSGGSESITYSWDNGETWRLSASSASVFAGEVRSAAWNGRVWVAAGATDVSGNGNTIATSVNGVDWMGRGKYVFSGNASGVAWAKELSQWVAVGSGGGNTAAYSHDGVYWYGTGIAGFSEGNDVAWNGHQWVAAGTAADGNARSIAYSVDGQSWTSVSGMFSTKATRVEWNGTFWTVFGDDPTYRVARSSDGIQWTLDTTVVSPTPVYTQLYFVKESSGNTFERSVDGQTWESRNTATDLSLSSVLTFAGNAANEAVANIQPLSIATGEGDNTLGYSIDGIGWTGLGSSVFSVRANRAAWNGRLWAAVGTNAADASASMWVATSYNGAEWTPRDSLQMTEGYDIAWNGHVFVAVGRKAGVGGIIATSPDGIRWTTQSSSLFTTRATAVAWTGYKWLVYGSGGNTAVESVDGQTWTPSAVPVVSDASSVFWQTGYFTGSSLSGFTATHSSTQSTYESYLVFDNSANTEWRCASGNYSGAYTGTTATTYNSTQTASGEWLQLALPTPETIVYYSVSFSTATPTAIPKQWRLLGSTNGSTWNQLDAFQFQTATPPDNTWKYAQMTIPLAIPAANVEAYTYYRLVVEATFGEIYVAISGVDLFMSNSKTATLDIRETPIVLKNNVLYMNRFTGKATYRLGDLSGNSLATNPQNGGEFVNTRVYGVSATAPVSATCFDGEHLFVGDACGNVAFLSNDAANNHLNFDISYNGQNIDSRLSAIYGACWNRRYVLFGGEGGITYGRLDAGTQWTETNAGQLFSRVNGVASNGGYGPVYIPNTVYLRENTTLRVVGPKAYSVPGEINISLNAHNAEIV